MKIYCTTPYQFSVKFSLNKNNENWYRSKNLFDYWIMKNLAKLKTKWKTNNKEKFYWKTFWSGKMRVLKLSSSFFFYEKVKYFFSSVLFFWSNIFTLQKCLNNEMIIIILMTLFADHQFCLLSFYVHSLDKLCVLHCCYTQHINMFYAQFLYISMKLFKDS